MYDVCGLSGKETRSLTGTYTGKAAAWIKLGWAVTINTWYQYSQHGVFGLRSEGRVVPCELLCTAVQYVVILVVQKYTTLGYYCGGPIE